jgi:lysyl-tRNA synthetase, class II
MNYGYRRLNIYIQVLIVLFFLSHLSKNFAKMITRQIYKIQWRFHYPLKIRLRYFSTKPDMYKKRRLEQLAGQEMYPHVQKTGPNESMATVRGRITSIRTAGKRLAFIDVRNEFKSHQVIMNNKRTDLEKMKSILSRVEVGDVYEFSGSFGQSLNGQDSMFAVDGRLLAPCLRQIPLELKNMVIVVNKNTRLRTPVLHHLVNTDSIVKLKTRSRLIRVLREYLHSRNFTEVETPILGTKAGGANAKPFETTLDTWKLPLFLRIAPELYLKQLVIGGMDRVFEIGKQFRNEGIDASHNPEFTTCEVYEAYTDLEHVISCIHDLFLRFANATHSSTKIVTHDGVDIDFAKPFKRVFCV